MYSGAEEERDGFKVGVGLHKVSGASPCLSAVVINRCGQAGSTKDYDVCRQHYDL